ncbi:MULTISPECIES: GlsB/YeaQ/YmgE family stress response membrane protein [Chryseobacterium]|uniref:GlsB/YeaQ/YmgE family stress response membrane protein n=1 Tax=Chryseobacterium TaxID=59732 RepID=UPI00227462EE|nr:MULTISPECIES: GlsB/YeaQ/YmgE family stress response membrane protein [Chryseobacterium]MCY1663191.1 GlsB/YeaQ/YmgE family stress response membrane protein [Chryseobacterium sp. SL1]WBV54386.1 GlsB/YeaQ/YmgE family stress response membrane protein [Chryseobacterium gambrini]
MFTFILWIIFGLVVGALAKMIMPGKQNMGWLMTCILGIIGAFVGGFIANAIFGGGGASDERMFHFWPIIFSVGGALIVLWIYGMITKKS